MRQISAHWGWYWALPCIRGYAFMAAKKPAPDGLDLLRRPQR